MSIVKSLDSTAVASATSVSVKQKNQQIAASLRPEIIVCTGQAQTGKTITENVLVQASGNADDIGTIFGFGSPLHRMAIKLFPKAGNGSKVTTYFLPVAAPTTSTAGVKTITVAAASGVTKSLNGYFALRDQAFEAAADVAGKVATIAHNNPAQDARGTILNSYETKYYPFTIIKGMTAAEAAKALADALEECLEMPFTIDKTNIATGVLALTSKWKGSDSYIDFKIVDEKGNVPANYGVTFTIAETVEAAGTGTIPEAALDTMDEELGVTRVVSQYATTTVLDALKEKFEAYHDGLIAQYILCYSAIRAPESESVEGTWDLATLISAGNERREDSINVQLVGDYGDLRKLKYPERNNLLKAGYSHLIKRTDGSYKLMDLSTFYHPVGKPQPLFKFDRDVAVVGNCAYDIWHYFNDSEDWQSVNITAEADITVNPKSRTLKDIKAALNSRIGLLGLAGLIANYKEAQKYTQVEIDSANSNRVNMNPNYDITGVSRIWDITNFVGFYFGN